MGLGQSLLSVLALVLLGVIVLGVNRNTADNGTVIERTEYEIMATSLGTSIIERATGLSFDEVTINADIGSPTSCTPTGTLGPDAGEVDSTYDDFDDFNGYNKLVSGDSLKFKSADYHILGTVQYCQVSGDTVIASASQTYNKLLTIRVWSSFMPDTLKFQTVYSYWYFR